MRMIDDTRNILLSRVWAYLIPSEARRIHDALAVYFEDDELDPDWHCHVEGDEGQELTLAVYPPDGATGKNAA